MARAPGTAVYLFSNPMSAPPALVANVRCNRVLHDNVLIVSVVTDAVPRVDRARRCETSDIGHGVHRVLLRYGFMEEPNVAADLAHGGEGFPAAPTLPTTYILGAESLVVTDRPGMARWREHLFARLSRNAGNAADYFSLPDDCTITLVTRVEL